MSLPDTPQPSARQRLQASREALMHQLQPSTRPATSRRVPLELDVDLADPYAYDEPTVRGIAADPAEASARSAGGTGMLSVARDALHSWWQFHPARTAVAIAQPVLAEYAHRRPLKLLGIAAGVGATLVVVRPWKLVSVGGLAVTALKSSQVSSLALSMLASRQKNTHKDPA